MPVHQIAVQSGHAAHEAGCDYNKLSPEPPSLIILAVKNKNQLQKALEHVRSLDIRVSEFDEPSWDYGFTSFATEPVIGDKRTPMRKYRLWNGKSSMKEIDHAVA